jgi:hypothetical protein
MRTTGGDWLYLVDDYWTLHVCYLGSTGLVRGEAYMEGRHRRKGLRVLDRGERSYLGDDGAGASPNGRGDDADDGESVGLAW